VVSKELITINDYPYTKNIIEIQLVIKSEIEEKNIAFIHLGGDTKDTLCLSILPTPYLKLDSQYLIFLKSEDDEYKLTTANSYYKTDSGYVDLYYETADGEIEYRPGTSIIDAISSILDFLE
jgi:hypothetical protein